jgi:YegS/Rv2252/BmrU family lipid kinase
LKPHVFIVNPRAGKGRGKRLGVMLEDIASRDSRPWKIVYTRSQGDAVTLARDAPVSVVVAVGGDGTVNEVANGIVGSGRALGIVPAGSGNDLMKSLGMKTTFEEAVSVLNRGRRRRIDIGLIEWESPTGPATSRYFVNGAGLGFDAAVAARANRIRFLKGIPLYLAAVLATITEYRPPLFTIRHDGAAEERSRRLLIAVGNGTCAGGGFYLTPDAMLDDGKIDICAIDALSAFGILAIIPRVLRASHRGSRGVEMMQTEALEIIPDPPCGLHADGEVLGMDVSRARIRAVPRAIEVIA